jgi:beta-N-acetylhexosaminidase
MKTRLAIIGAIIAAGLSLRAFGPGLGLPFFLVKYGGSILWATMVYFLFGLMAGERPRCSVAAGAMMIAAAVEASRLYHTPWLDAFRLTPPGALLLGRVFSLWNLAAYACGVALGVAIDPGAIKGAPPLPCAGRCGGRVPAPRDYTGPDI